MENNDNNEIMETQPHNDNINKTPTTAPLSDKAPVEAIFIKSLAGWATFKAVIDLLQGGLAAISFFGMIIAGVIMGISNNFTDEFTSSLEIEGNDFFTSFFSSLSLVFILIALIVGAFAVFKILAGIKLLRAVDKIREYLRYNLFDRIYAYMYDMSKHFKYTGFSIIVYLGGTLLFIIGYIFLIFSLINSTGDFFNDFYNMSFLK